MAKKNSRGRVRVFFAEFEGEDDTIQEGMKALAVAVNKTFQPKVIVQQTPPANLLDQRPAQMELFDDDDEEVEEYLEESEQGFEAEVKPVKKRSKRKSPQLQMVKDLDLVPKGKTSFKQFFSSKSPQQQNEAILVCLYWLRKVLEIDGVKANHIYHCLKEVGVKIPSDLPQTIRNIANRKAWFDTSDSNNLEITTPGENYVDHSLGGSNNGD